jgi:type II secretory pathway component PulK
MMNNRKGIALITTLWVVVLMTLFASVYVLVSNMDIFTSMIMNAQKRALLNAETGKNYFFSLRQYKNISYNK